MSCPLCPVSADLYCPGLDASRVCNLIDPAHPDYRAGYREVILAAARRENPDLVIARVEEARRAWQALPPEQRAGCGGCP